MKPFTTMQGIVAAMDRSNVDTDQIIPKQFLKRIERTGFGANLFFDWRFDDQGQPDLSFELNQTKFEGASILLARQNFGCGSSREHAVWAIEDYGFRAVIAESFADIFHNNCFKNGVLPITMDSGELDELFRKADQDEPFELSIDLAEQAVTGPNGFHYDFEINEYQKNRLLNGLDDIAITLQHEHSIAEFESRRGYESVGP